MKKVSILILAVIALGVVAGFFLFIFNWYVHVDPEAARSNEMERPNSENIYHDLRQMALSTTAETLELQNQPNTMTVHGVVLDWHLGEGIATLVAFRTGDVSVYLSSGGGIIGGFSHDNVRKAASDFIGLAQEKLPGATKTLSTPLPENDEIKFYFLTNEGTFVAEENMKNMENESSQWLDLFVTANHLITELRQVSTDQADKGSNDR